MQYEASLNFSDQREFQIRGRPIPMPTTALLRGQIPQCASETSPPIAFTNFINTVGRLERLLDRETAMLSECQPITFDDFNRKKNHGLIELRHALDAVRSLGCEGIGLDPKPALAQLRVKLQKNLASLQTHLDAARTIASVIARGLQEHESNGTYTPAVIHKGNNG